MARNYMLDLMQGYQFGEGLQRQKKIDEQADADHADTRRLMQKNESRADEAYNKAQKQEQGAKEVAGLRNDQAIQIIQGVSKDLNDNGIPENTPEHAAAIEKMLPLVMNPEAMAEAVVLGGKINKSLENGQTPSSDLMARYVNIVGAGELDQRGGNDGLKREVAGFLPNPTNTGVYVNFNVTRPDGTTYQAPATVGASADPKDNIVKEFKPEDFIKWYGGTRATLIMLLNKEKEYGFTTTADAIQKFAEGERTKNETKAEKEREHTQKRTEDLADRNTLTAAQKSEQEYRQGTLGVQLDQEKRQQEELNLKKGEGQVITTSDGMFLLKKDGTKINLGGAPDKKSTEAQNNATMLNVMKEGNRILALPDDDPSNNKEAQIESYNSVAPRLGLKEITSRDVAVPETSTGWGLWKTTTPATTKKVYGESPQTGKQPTQPTAVQPVAAVKSGLPPLAAFDKSPAPPTTGTQTTGQDNVPQPAQSNQGPGVAERLGALAGSPSGSVNPFELIAKMAGGAASKITPAVSEIIKSAPENAKKDLLVLTDPKVQKIIETEMNQKNITLAQAIEDFMRGYTQAQMQGK